MHQHRSYISFTVHFVDSLKVVQTSLCLQTREIPKDYTAKAIQQVLSSLFEEWHISSKVFGATTDNGQTIVYAIDLLSLEHFPCLAQTLQLAINPLRPKLILVCQKMQKIACIRNNKSLIFKNTTHFSKKLYIFLICIKQGIQ